jgi:DNA topoisomerase I
VEARLYPARVRDPGRSSPEGSAAVSTHRPSGSTSGSGDTWLPAGRRCCGCGSVFPGELDQTTDDVIAGVRHRCSRTSARAGPERRAARPPARPPRLRVARPVPNSRGVRQLDLLREDGIRRLGTPRSGFRYVTASDRPAAKQDVARIHGLRLPPAWTDVFASTSPTAKLQAVGRDKAGRWQYRYHPEFVQRRADAKYRRLQRFAAELPRMRAAVERDLSLHGLPREKVMACTVRILATCFMRAGSERHMKENGSFGVATLRGKHVEVQGDLVRFDYPGKSGKRHVCELRDRKVARVVKELLEVPGRDVFKFEADDGWVDVRRRHINAYVKEIMGGPFTAKDFRTWAGTLICACELARRKPGMVPGRTSAKRTVSAAVKATAEMLGNTPAVCRSSYISPFVFSCFERGRVIADHLEAVAELGLHSRGLHPSEKALLKLLGNGGARRAILTVADAKGPAEGRSAGDVLRGLRDMRSEAQLHG